MASAGGLLSLSVFRLPAYYFIGFGKPPLVTREYVPTHAKKRTDDAFFNTLSFGDSFNTQTPSILFTFILSSDER